MLRRLLIGALVAAAVVTVAVGQASATPTVRGATGYPSSLVVVGDDVAQGYGSDPGHPYRDTPANSWASGTNPAVDSIYSRILSANPAVRGHAVNLAQDDAGIADLPGQIGKAVALTPKPELVLVQIDGDVECDGKDQSRIADFGTQFSAALDSLRKGLPNARIFVVSSWGSFASYVTYLNGLTKDARLKHAGKSLCQFVEAPSGRVVPSHVAYVQKTVYGYDKQLAAACAKVTSCRYDGGAAQRLTTTADDISVDQEHLTIQGQAKLAAAEWAAMAGFVDRR